MRVFLLCSFETISEIFMLSANHIILSTSHYMPILSQRIVVNILVFDKINACGPKQNHFPLFSNTWVQFGRFLYTSQPKSTLTDNHYKLAISIVVIPIVNVKSRLDLTWLHMNTHGETITCKKYHCACATLLLK